MAALALLSTSLVQADESRIHAQAGKGVVRVLSMEDAETAPPFGPAWFSDTGVLLSEDGHVIAPAALANRTASIVAILADERRYTGTLIGTDPYSNLALFKLPGAGHEPPRQATAGSLADGDYVYAVVATSDGRRERVSAQVRNARRIMTGRNYPPLPYIEIEDNNPDMPVRGPVFDETGQLVGFVTLRSGAEHKMPVVLAVPASDVHRMAEDLRTWGRVRRSRIGAHVKLVPRDLAASRGLREPTGALVAEVERRSPAARADLRVDDIILKIDEVVIASADDYLVAMQRIRPGTRIVLEILDPSSRRRRLHVTTAEIMSGPPVGQPAPDRRKTLP